MESEHDFKILTKTEVIEVLRNALNCKSSEIEVNSFKIIPVSNSEIVGLLGEYFHLVISAKVGNIKESKTFEYFVKSVPITDELQKDMISQTGFFPKETEMYTTIFKELEKYETSKWHAKCFYVRPDVLVMEDLRKLNYRHLGEDELFSIDHLKVVLKRIASMHANSIILEERTGINIGEKYKKNLQEIQILTGTGWFRAGVRAVQAVAYKIPKFQKNNIKQFLDEDYMKCIDRVLEILEGCNEYRKVFTHRDLWIKNILFKYDDLNPSRPVDSIFVDFQLSRYHPPAIDVLQSIYLNTNRKTRDNHISELLKFYYDCLRSELSLAAIDVEKHITWDEFIRSSEDVKLVPIMLSGVYTQLANLPDGYLYDLMNKDSEGYNGVAVVERSKFVLDRMEEFQSYKERMLECTEEIVEYLMKL